MRKLSIPNPKSVVEAIYEEMRTSDEARHIHRLHGVLLVAQGMSCNQASQYLRESPRSVQRWVNAFLRAGFDGLREGRRSGRPSTLDQRQMARLGRELRRSPRKFGLNRNLWDGPLMREHLLRNHGVDLSVRQCQRLFKKLGL